MDLVVTGDRVGEDARGVETPWRVLDACRRLLDEVCAAHAQQDEGRDAARRSVRRRRVAKVTMAPEPARPAPPEAAVWLLDNAAYLRLAIRETRDTLSRRYYRGLPAIGDDPARPGTGLPEGATPYVRHLARCFVEQPIEQIDAETVTRYFEQAQAGRPLALRELWALAPMLKLALFEQLRAELTAGHLDSPDAAAGVQAVVVGLRALDELPWRELTESLCLPDAILRGDPAGIYATMDFETRDVYRRAVESVAHGARTSEEAIALMAVGMAGEADGHAPPLPAGDDRYHHVGYYLVGPGRPRLEQRAGCRGSWRQRVRKAVARHPLAAHLGTATALTLAILAGLAHWLGSAPWWYLLVLAVPSSEAALAVANTLAHLVVAPDRLPRLDFSSAVPDDCRTLVVVPALLFEPRTIDALCERLEVNHLANRDPNVLFALLTDVADSRERGREDEEMGRACAEAVERLNERHAGRPFFLFHRARTWNQKERTWMGHERKRGKLNDLNAWLLGGPDPFIVKAGDLGRLRSIRYVITLDADTRLPLDAARMLVGTAAHPLNRPVLDGRTKVVRQGYAVLQPRVSVSVESATASRLARIRSGAVGVDPYATAVSDVYQDVYGQATFTGKGLYDLAAFHAALDGRFPDNALLSHDLIEGEHARVGLVSDVEVVDDYPRTYDVYSKRKHRWTRGDWQLLYWLLPRVPAGGRAWRTNPLSLLSRWKIADNLRRSTLDIAATAAIVAAWFVLPAHALRATAAVGALLVAGAYADAVLSFVRLPPRRLLAGFLREKAVGLARAHADALIALGLVLHQAMLMLDAIGRTLVRCFITKRRLLEWETTAQAESAAGTRHASLARVYLLITPGVAAALLLVSLSEPRDRLARLAIAALWASAPLVAGWLSRPGHRAFAWSRQDVTFLRGLGLRTWRYFDDWSDARYHYLVPDTLQEAPEHVAAQTSPTNIGLQLAATLAARDFGYLTSREMAAACTRVLDTVERLERHRGHLYNWYDTRTLAPLAPRYVSTVDSGNLCAALVAVKQGCGELRAEPIVGNDHLAGLRDHWVRVRNALPRRLRRTAVARSITGVLRQLDRVPSDAFAWSRLLASLRPSAIAVDEWLRVTAARSPFRSDVSEAAEWARRLVERIDEVWRDLRRAAPWVGTPEGEDVPRAIVDVLSSIPSPAGAERHYDAIAAAVRTAMDEKSVSWQQHARLLRQVAQARLAVVDTDRALESVARRCDRLVADAEFAFLFDARKKLLRIGYNADTGELDPSYYDLLASEARTAILLAIAKGEIPPKAWAHLGRKLTSSDGTRVLVSWGGTMFEHLMPSLFMHAYEGSLLAASGRAMVRVQQAHGAAHGVPWGFSEAAHSVQDVSGRYGYRTFGVPRIAMRRMGAEDLVVAPYAAVLAAMVDPHAAAENLRVMASKGWIGTYGLFESVDYSSRRTSDSRRGRVVRSFMAHHQGMSVVALCNALLGPRMPRRFHAEPMVAAAERLLQERVPSRVPSEEPDDRLVAPASRDAVTRRPDADALAPPPAVLSGFGLARLPGMRAASRRVPRRTARRLLDWRRLASTGHR